MVNEDRVNQIKMARFTKADFITAVVGELQNNPRGILKGHGIPTKIVKEIQARPGVMQKLATILYTLKSANRLSTGLKKTNTLMIKGFNNYKEFVDKAPDVLNEFEGSLPTDDAIKYDGKNDCIVIVMIPSKFGKWVNTEQYFDDDVQEMVSRIVTDGSEMLTYNRAISAQYRWPGAKYLLVTWGKSAIRPKHVKVSLQKRRRNSVLEEKINKAVRVKARLKKKVAKELRLLNKELRNLNKQKSRLLNASAQHNAINAKFGGNYGAVNAQFTKGRQQALAGINAWIEGLNDFDKNIWNKLIKLRPGDSKISGLIAASSDPASMRYVLGVYRKEPKAPSAVVNTRLKKYKKELSALNKENKEILETLNRNEDRNPKVVSALKRKYNSNKRKVAAVKAKIDAIAVVGTENVQNYQQLLAQINGKIAQNLQKGATVRATLQKAIQELNIPQQVKQQLTAQAIDAAIEGIEVPQIAQQIAQQVVLEPGAQSTIQALQAQLDMRDEYGDDYIEGDFDMDELLSAL